MKTTTEGRGRMVKEIEKMEKGKGRRKGKGSRRIREVGRTGGTNDWNGGSEGRVNSREEKKWEKRDSGE